MRTKPSLLALSMAAVLLAALPPGAPAAANKKALADCRVLVVEKFEVDNKTVGDAYPGGFEDWLQRRIVMRLNQEELFAEVVDGRETVSFEALSFSGLGAAGCMLVLSGTVIRYDKGSRAKRLWISFGAGAATVRVRFVFRDGETGQEVLRTERRGKSYWSGQKEEGAITGASGDIINGLIKAIKRNR